MALRRRRGILTRYLAAHAAGLPREALADHVLGLGSKIVHHAMGRHLDFGYYRLPADDDGAFHRFHDDDAKPTPRPTPRPAPRPTPRPVTLVPTQKITPARFCVELYARQEKPQ